MEEEALEYISATILNIIGALQRVSIAQQTALFHLFGGVTRLHPLVFASMANTLEVQMIKKKNKFFRIQKRIRGPDEKALRVASSPSTVVWRPLL